MCAQDAGCSQTAQIPLFRQVRHERFHLVCLTNTALQAGEEANLATIVHVNFSLSGETLDAETTRATPTYVGGRPCLRLRAPTISLF